MAHDKKLSLRGPGGPGALFALGLVAVGHLVAWSSQAYWGPPGGASGPWLPVWAFVLVWTALDFCLGVATVLALRARTYQGTSALVPISSALAVVLLWMPLACALGTAWAPLALDLVAASVLLLAARAYRRLSPLASRWLMPLLVWMPITTLASLSTWLSS